mmetsp:Transcript_14078/g.43607  ORF Transcript_14078/g.43607 Transcript_14078/m.43607 type:complete len:310 (-) Transcript_14078:3-932(-)
MLSRVVHQGWQGEASHVPKATGTVSVQLGPCSVGVAAPQQQERGHHEVGDRKGRSEVVLLELPQDGVEEIEDDQQQGIAPEHGFGPQLGQPLRTRRQGLGVDVVPPDPDLEPRHSHHLGHEEGVGVHHPRPPKRWRRDGHDKQGSGAHHNIEEHAHQRSRGRLEQPDGRGDREALQVSSHDKLWQRLDQEPQLIGDADGQGDGNEGEDDEGVPVGPDPQLVRVVVQWLRFLSREEVHHQEPRGREAHVDQGDVAEDLGRNLPGLGEHSCASRRSRRACHRLLVGKALHAAGRSGAAPRGTPRSLGRAAP